MTSIIHRFIRTTLCCIILIVITISLEAQVSPPEVSAAALAYGKYADIPVNHATGTGNISIPVYSISDGPLTLPINLNYHTAGLLVQSPARGEMVHMAGVGAYAGAVGGAIGAAINGDNVGTCFGNGALYGAIGGAVQATLNVAVMGPAFVPERTYGFFEDGKQPVYRSGGLTWLSGRGTGIALGRNLVTHQYKDKLSYDNQHLRAHETAHFIQMGTNGFGKFYGGTASQYAKYGINWRNPNNVYNQPTSYEYAADRYADQWFKLWP